MKYRCSQCGAMIPDDSDFCYGCGADKSKAYAVPESADAGIAVCPMCKGAVDPGATFCPSCGSAVVRMEMPRPVNNAILALVAGLIPGFVDIHGLGHLVLKRYKRAALFLALTVLINLLKFGFYFGGGPGFMQGAFIFLSLAVFLIQMMDLLSLAYGGPGLSFRMPRR